MGLSKHGYGIHGTNEPNSIGRAASHGCIRMARTDLEEFYALVAEGDRVELIGQRNQQTAQLFGNGAVSAVEPVLAIGPATRAPNPAGEAASEEATASLARAALAVSALR
jgi:hypothetical protein